jgi:ribose transport system permease protein
LKTELQVDVERRALPRVPERRRRWQLFWQNFGYAWFSFLLLLVLLTVNLILDPKRFAPGSIGTTLGLTAPLILAAMASLPPILAGGGGIDLSVGPFMGLVNALVVQELFMSWGITSPLVVVPFAVAVGVASGLVNGTLASVLRLQPIVATLGTYLVYAGLTLWLVPTPSGTVPSWLANLAGQASVVPIVGVLVVWYGLTRLPYYDHLMATGGDERAAYTSTVPVVAVRVGAYILAGVFAAVAGLSLTALLGSTDPNVGPTYTLTAIASVALGGVSLGGGRGGMLGAMVGAVDIFLIQNILTYFNASSFTLQAAYGAILVAAVVLNAVGGRIWRRLKWSIA